MKKDQRYKIYTIYDDRILINCTRNDVDNGLCDKGIWNGQAAWIKPEIRQMPTLMSIFTQPGTITGIIIILFFYLLFHYKLKFN